MTKPTPAQLKRLDALAVLLKSNPETARQRIAARFKLTSFDEVDMHQVGESIRLFEDQARKLGLDTSTIEDDEPVYVPHEDSAAPAKTKEVREEQNLFTVCVHDFQIVGQSATLLFKECTICTGVLIEPMYRGKTRNPDGTVKTGLPE